MDDAARKTDTDEAGAFQPAAPDNVTEIRRAEPKAARLSRLRRPSRGRRAIRKRTLLFGLLPVALIAGGYAYVRGGQVMSTDNAYVQADIVGISTDVAGMVGEIDVRDNQPVKAGDTLFKLDDKPFRFALERADAQIGVVRNDLEGLKASYKSMQSQIAQGEADIAFYQHSLQAPAGPRRPSPSPRRRPMTQAKHDLDGAQQKLVQLQRPARRHRRQPCNGQPDAPVEQHPRYRDAVAARAEAARQLEHTVVRAPMDGIVTNVPSLQKGQYLEGRDRGLQPGFHRPCLGPGQPQGDRADLGPPGPEGRRSMSTPIPARAGRARSTASARPRPRASRCCRRRTPPATGSRSCSASPCA